MFLDVFEDFVSPVTAAQTLLHSVAKKRKDMLQKAMEFVMTVLTNPASTPRQKDGALHMVGTVADVLLKVNSLETFTTFRNLAYVKMNPLIQKAFTQLINKCYS